MVDSTPSETCCSRRKAGTRRKDWVAKQQLSPQIKEKITNACKTISLIKKKKIKSGVPVVAQCVKNPTSVHEDVGSIPGLPQRIKDPALL